MVTVNLSDNRFNVYSVLMNFSYNFTTGIGFKINLPIAFLKTKYLSRVPILWYLQIGIRTLYGVTIRFI